MDNQTLLKQAASHLEVWLKERDITDMHDVERYLSAYLYGDLVDLHRKYNASDEQLGAYVRMFNDFIEAEMAKF